MHVQDAVLRLVAYARGVKIDLSDAYTNWLRTMNAGMLHRGNLYCFDYAVRNMPAGGRIVEIGSFCGLSANAITYYKRKAGVTTPLVTCDGWIFYKLPETDIYGSPKSIPEYREYVMETFRRNVSFYSSDDLPHTVESNSDDFFAAWRAGTATKDVFGRDVQLGGPISFAYIDGNHTYPFVRRDVENATEFLLPGGFLLLDDSSSGDPQRVAREIAKNDDRYELVARNPNYLFRKRLSP